MNTLKGSIGNRSGTTIGLGTPCDLETLGVSDGAWGRWRPEAEIINPTVSAVTTKMNNDKNINSLEPSGLTLRRLGRGSAACIRSALSVLAFGGKGVRHVARVPYLYNKL